MTIISKFGTGVPRLRAHVCLLLSFYKANADEGCQILTEPQKQKTEICHRATA